MSKCKYHESLEGTAETQRTPRSAEKNLKYENSDLEQSDEAVFPPRQPPTIP
jgi:hypothetical protein